MKFNKWTLGLAALGVVSLSSATQALADDNMNYLESTLKGVTVSGYVDTSIEVGIDPTESRYLMSPMGRIPFRATDDKRDGFNLNVVELNIEKPLDEGQWASGFKVSLLFGPDAVGFNTSVNALTSSGSGTIVDGGDGVAGDPDGPGPLTSDDTVSSGSSSPTLADFGIKQAYVALRTPVGNGIDWKIGVFDTIVGYEVFEAGSNPNFTRSFGYAIEPTQHTGVLASYKVSDLISVSAGIANTLNAGINSRNTTAHNGYWSKTVMGSIAATAPDSWGFLAGSSFYVGLVDGFVTDSFGQLNFYAGAVINTPVEGLTTGLAFDYVNYDSRVTTFNSDDVYNLGIYASYKATEKLSLHARGEYGWLSQRTPFTGPKDVCWYGLTATIQYDLWENVVSRLEYRYESIDSYDVLMGPGYASCGSGFYANVIYKF